VTIAEAIRSGAARLAAAGIEGARLEARLLLAHALAMRPEQVLLSPDMAVDPEAYDRLVARRAAREPLALILGHREFWSLDFAVSPDTLVPRPDSETLIEAALAALPRRETVRRVLDLGTGTGCLLLAALTEFPAAFGIGLDRVPAAVRLAQHNAATIGLVTRTAFLCGDWAAPLAGRFDLILCNPPYIPAGDIAGLMPDVARYEPVSALSGGADGLDAYRAVIPSLPGLLGDGGVAVLEVGQGQAQAVAALGTAGGLRVSVRSDLSGIERAVILARPPGKSSMQPGATKKPFGSAGCGG
jgi:release factor glutamine methyltransferase